MNNNKSWKEYLTEFAMLFLAISLGFLAENLREDQTDSKQLNILVKHLFQEIQKDTATLKQMNFIHNMQDTAFLFLEKLVVDGDLDSNKTNIYYLHSFLCERTGIFETSSSAALEQLKYTGLLSNIDDLKLRDCIEKFDLMLLHIQIRSQREIDFMNRYIDDIRIEPFDYGGTKLKRSLDPFYVGKNMTLVSINYQNKLFKLELDNIFVPNNLVLKEFDKSTYLNRMRQLCTIRMSTNRKQIIELQLIGNELLRNLKRVYPHINKSDKKHN